MSERVVVDRGGRIVIPKRLRERLGVRAGDLLAIEEADGGLRVSQEKEVGGLVERGGLLFKPRDRKSGALDPAEVNRLIDIMRDPLERTAFEGRLRKPSGRRKKRGAR